MRVRFTYPIAVLALVALTATSASAYIRWAGPGYYLLENYYLLSGPYSVDADCEAALSQPPQREQYDTNAHCEFEATDPDAYPGN